MRTRGPVEEDADRERDRDDDAAEDAEDEHACECRDASAARRPRTRRIDQIGRKSIRPTRRRRSRRRAPLRERLDQRHRDQEEQADDPAATTAAACDLAPAASLTAVREFEDETGKPSGRRDVRRAERRQLPVRVDLVAVLLRERAHRPDRVGESDQRKRGRGKQRDRRGRVSTSGRPSGGSPPSRRRRRRSHAARSATAANASATRAPRSTAARRQESPDAERTAKAPRSGDRRPVRLAQLRDDLAERREEVSTRR